MAGKKTFDDYFQASRLQADLVIENGKQWTQEQYDERARKEAVQLTQMYGDASTIPSEYLNNGGNLQEAYTLQLGVDGSLTDFAGKANNLMSSYLADQSLVGPARHMMARQQDQSRSKIEQIVGGSLLDNDGHPEGPGFNYFNHLFRRVDADGQIKKAKKEELTKGMKNIYTEAQEALKMAIKALGVASNFNPTGLPVDIKDAQKLWFGDEEADDVKINQWRTSVEMGDEKIDPKKVRKFTNYDGSLTWEILNDDKTVSSRFTLGEFAGVKIFAQGGYNKFVEMLEKVKQQVGYDESTSFESARSKFSGI